MTQQQPKVLEQSNGQIGGIDDWRSNRKLALAVEMKVSAGKLLICTANLFAQNSDLVSRQLLYSLQRYMLSSDFEPSDSLTIEEIKGILRLLNIV